MKISRYEGLPYRPCVGMMIFNTQGLVWVGKRNMASSSEGTFLWQMPQGGIHENEEHLDAAKREIYEETGMTSIRFLEQTSSWLYYDIPPASLSTRWQNKYRGQMQKWFAFHFYGEDSEISLFSKLDAPVEFTTWMWCPMDALPNLVVPFKRDIYIEVIKKFMHLQKIFVTSVR